MKKKLNDFLPDTSAPGTLYVTHGIQAASDFMLIVSDDIKNLFKQRKPFSNKSTYGHALIIAGARDTMGAAILASKGCLYAGAGLTTASIPESGLNTLNTTLPEVMFSARTEFLNSGDLTKYNAIAIGPGIGKSKEGIALLEKINRLKFPVIADADALNIVSDNKDLLQKMASGSILTPHVKEFDRLYGDHKNWWERIQTAKAKAIEKEVIIVLKNQYTFIIDQQGLVYINPTGNPAMAQGGMGDVLTGIIAAYVAQRYGSRDAAILGCYFHGLSGNELAADHFNVSASQVAAHLPLAVKRFLEGSNISAAFCG